MFYSQKTERVFTAIINQILGPGFMKLINLFIIIKNKIENCSASFPELMKYNHVSVKKTPQKLQEIRKPKKIFESVETAYIR